MTAVLNGNTLQSVARTPLRPARLSSEARIQPRAGEWAFALDAVPVLLVLVAVNASNYLFHAVMSRKLGPSDYGALGALLGILWVVSVPVGALQAVVARRVARLDPSAPAALAGVVRPGLRLGLATGGALALVLAAAAPLTAKFLRLDSALPVILMSAVVVPACVSAVGRGALQGLRRFGILAISLLLAVVVRLVLGVVWAEGGLGISGALLATLAAELSGTVLALSPLFRRIRERSGRRRVTGLSRETVDAAISLFNLWLLVTADVVLARHYLDPHTAGQYAAASLAAKVVVFLASGIALVAYPRFAADGWGSRRVLARSALLVAGLGLSISFFFLFLPKSLALAFGGDFGPAGLIASLLALGMTGFGLTTLATYHRLGSQRSPAKALWLALGVEMVAFGIVPARPASMAVVVAATGWLTGIGLLLHVGIRVDATPRPRRRALEEADPEVDLSVITPTFNGASNLPAMLDSLLVSLRATGIRHEVIVVSDGSTDGTPEAARGYLNEGVRVLHYRKNQGKGHALRAGLARARGRHVAFIDSDGDLDPEDLVRFLSLVQMYDADLVVGSKRHPCSHVSYPILRRLMSWSYHKLVRVLFGIRVRDTQTGIKLIRRDALRLVLPLLRENRYAFDLELIVALRRAGYVRVFEAPVNLGFRFNSTISAKAVAGIILDTLSIWWRSYVIRCYEPGVIHPRTQEHFVAQAPLGLPAGVGSS